MAVLIKGGHVVTGDAAGTRHEAADLLIRDGRIAALGPDLDRDPAAG